MFTVVVSLEVNELRSVLGSISSTILLSRAWIISPYAVWDAMLLKGQNCSRIGFIPIMLSAEELMTEHWRMSSKMR